IEHPHQNQVQNGRIYDFCDSEAYKCHPLFSRDQSALQIMLYYDDVEVVNPLGSKTKKHKIGKQSDASNKEYYKLLCDKDRNIDENTQIHE
ncbi:hypothetical protein QZH41_008118, partial [Actinostola sp. cb2023]